MNKASFPSTITSCYAGSSFLAIKTIFYALLLCVVTLVFCLLVFIGHTFSLSASVIRQRTFIHCVLFLIVCLFDRVFAYYHAKAKSLGYLSLDSKVRKLWSAPFIIFSLGSCVLVLFYSLDYFQKGGVKDAFILEGVLIIEALVTWCCLGRYMIIIRRHNRQRLRPDVERAMASYHEETVLGGESDVQPLLNTEFPPAQFPDPSPSASESKCAADLAEQRRQVDQADLIELLQRQKENLARQVMDLHCQIDKFHSGFSLRRESVSSTSSSLSKGTESDVVDWKTRYIQAGEEVRRLHYSLQSEQEALAAAHHTINKQSTDLALSERIIQRKDAQIDELYAEMSRRKSTSSPSPFSPLSPYARAHSPSSPLVSQPHSLTSKSTQNDPAAAESGHSGSEEETGDQE
eukprot:GCRY01003340.1.p1 GENE.GCRY01003340.1~~GCRY01003340.1.p1  ORF type:complete len:404 (-),score=53.25 GCRY01003340.1:113-1324(-)